MEVQHNTIDKIKENYFGHVRRMGEENLNDGIQEERQ